MLLSCLVNLIFFIFSPPAVFLPAVFGVSCDYGFYFLRGNPERGKGSYLSFKRKLVGILREWLKSYREQIMISIAPVPNRPNHLGRFHHPLFFFQSFQLSRISPSRHRWSCTFARKHGKEPTCACVYHSERGRRKYPGQ